MSSVFFEQTLPIMITILLAAAGAMWSVVSSGRSIEKRFDDMNRRLDEIVKRLDSIDTLLKEHDRDITALKERSGMVRMK